MPCLRTRFNYAAVYLGDNSGVVGRSLVEGKVRIKTHSGKRQYLWFDGFIERVEVQTAFTPVKLLDIEAYIHDHLYGEWVEFGSNSQCLGVLTREGKVMCVLVDSSPVVWCDID